MRWEFISTCNTFTNMFFFDEECSEVSNVRSVFTGHWDYCVFMSVGSIDIK